MKKKSLPVIGAGVGVLLTLGVGGALASGVIGGEVQPTSDDSVYVAPSETAAATTTDAPTAEVAVVPAENPSVPVEPPVAEAPAATVGGVTEPMQTQAPHAQEAAPAPYDPQATWTDDAGRTYLPAPDAVPEPLPGEPGYVPSGG